MKRYLVQFSEHPICLSCWVQADSPEAARLNAIDLLHRTCGVRLPWLQSSLQGGHVKIDSRTELLETIQQTIATVGSNPEAFLDIDSKLCGADGPGGSACVRASGHDGLHMTATCRYFETAAG